MNTEPKIYGTILPLSGKSVESYETLLERYPWFDAARRLTNRKGEKLPANLLLANYFYPSQDTFKQQGSNPNFQTIATGSTPPPVPPVPPPPIPYTEAERLAAEAITRREQQRAKRADADEADFPTTTGISTILSGSSNSSDMGSDDIIAAFVSGGGDYRIDFSQPADAPKSVSSKPLPTPDTDPTLKSVMEFLAMGELHIDPEEIVPSPDKERLEGPIDLSADDIVTEELGAIYLKQNLLEEAKEIYSKLSLQNPEKSGYFATLIAEAEARADIKKAEKTRGLKR